VLSDCWQQSCHSSILIHAPLGTLHSISSSEAIRLGCSVCMQENLDCFASGLVDHLPLASLHRRSRALKRVSQPRGLWLCTRHMHPMVATITESANDSAGLGPDKAPMLEEHFRAAGRVCLPRPWGTLGTLTSGAINTGYAIGANLEFMYAGRLPCPEVPTAMYHVLCRRKSHSKTRIVITLSFSISSALQRMSFALN
jgi:hypothetical protein